jgi:hypothetical protein
MSCLTDLYVSGEMFVVFGRKEDQIFRAIQNMCQYNFSLPTSNSYHIPSSPDNNICDIFEFENLIPLLNLTHIRLEPGNPITSLENWRLVFIHMLPQLLWLDGQRLEPAEIVSRIYCLCSEKLIYFNHLLVVSMTLNEDEERERERIIKSKMLMAHTLLYG